MTKICHVTSVHNTNDVRIFKKECTSLAKKDNYEVFIVGEGSENRNENNVQFVACGERPKSRKERMLRFSKKVVDEALNLNADVYHLHDPELLRYAFKFKKNNKKVIYDSHENDLESIDDKSYMPKIMRNIFKIYYSSLQKRILPKLDGIVVVSPQMIDNYRKYNENIVLVENFPIFKEDKPREVLKSIDGRFIFAGGVSDLWSHKEIISAINDIDNCEYYIYGDGEESYIEELENIAEKSKVHICGKVSFDKVQEEIEKAQFVFSVLKPSKGTFGWEGTLGNTKLFEAMGKGKPVIASKLSLWKDIVENNHCGICVDPYNVDEIKKTIKKMLSLDAETIAIMGENGKKAIVEEYNWNICEKKLFQLYDYVIGER